MVDQHNFLCHLWSLIKRMLIARALGVPVLNVIFGLFCGMLLCFCVIRCSNGARSNTVSQERHMAMETPSTAPFSLFYRPHGGHDPTITLPKSEWVKN